MGQERDSGAVLVTVAVSFVAILAAGALALDLGSALVERRQARNAADHAALAAAWADCNGRDAQSAAEASAVRNHYAASDLTLTDTADGWRAVINTTTDMQLPESSASAPWT